MGVFISILRGINVSGKKRMQMTDLKSLYEKLGFKEVTTYIQSGNVIFKSDKKQTHLELANQIELIIQKNYNFSTPVIIRTLEEMQDVIADDPLLEEKGIDLEKLHVTFLSAVPEPERIENIKNLDYSPDKFVIINKEVYLYCPNGYGITKLSNTFWENKLKVTATTRNWNTVNKLVELAVNIS